MQNSKETRKFKEIQKIKSDAKTKNEAKDPKTKNDAEILLKNQLKFFMKLFHLKNSKNNFLNFFIDSMASQPTPKN